MPSARASSTSPWPIVLVLVTAAALRLPNLFESLWYDEYLTSASMAPHVSLLLKTIYGDIHPPGYLMFGWCWATWVGSSELMLRLPAMVFGLGTIWLVHRASVSWFEGDTGRRVGLVAATFLALSPTHIWYSQEARPYSGLMFFATAFVVWHARMRRGDADRWAGWGLGLLAFALVFTHFFVVAFVATAAVLALGPRARRRRAIWLATGIPSLLVVGYVGAKMYVSEFLSAKYYLRAFDLGEAWQLFFNWFLCGNVFSPRHHDTWGGWAVALLVFQVVGVIAFGLGVLRVARAGRDSGAPGWHVLAFLFSVPVFLLVLPLLGLDHTYIERSAVLVLPLYAVVVAAGIVSCGRGFRPAWAALLICQVAAVFASHAHQGLWTVYKPNPDWRSAAAYLTAEIEGGGSGRPIYSNYKSPDTLSYYEPRIQLAKRFVENSARYDRLRDSAASMFGADSVVVAAIAGVLDEYATLQREAEAATRLRIYQLSEHDPSGDTAAPGPDDRFYLLHHALPGGADPAVTGLLESGRVRVVSERRLDSLTVYEVMRSR